LPNAATKVTPGTGLAGVPLNQKFGRTATTTLRAYGVDSFYNALQLSAQSAWNDVPESERRRLEPMP